MSTAFWVCAAITAASSFVSVGYSVAAMRAAAPDDNTSEMYAAARSVAIAVAAVVAFFVGSEGFLAAIALTMIAVQSIDALVGVKVHDRLATVGPAVTAIVNAAALVWMLGSTT